MNIFFKMTYKSLTMNKTRTMVTIIGIILSAAMITAVTTLISSLQDFILDYAMHQFGDWHGAFYDVDGSTAESLKSDEKIKTAAFADNIGYADIGSSNEYKPYLFIMGADDLFMETMPVHLTSGELPRTPEEIILPEHLAYNGGVTYKIGDEIRLEIGDRYYRDSRLMQNNPFIPSEKADDNGEKQIIEGEKLAARETRTYTVVGFYERPDFEEYTAPGYTAVTKMDPARVSGSYAVYFKMKNPRDAFEYVSGSAYGGTTNDDVLLYMGFSRYNNFYTVLYSLAAILIGLIMFGSVSLIYNAFAISVSERTRQFGLLTSVGATRRQNRKMVLYEALIVSIIGIPLGILGGILGISITLRLTEDKFYSFINIESVKFDLNVSVESIIAACIIALITVLISAWIPSRRATKVTAIDAIRLSKDITAKPGDVKTSKLTYKLFGLEGMLAKKHFKRSRKKYRATVVSLFMSIVLFISASSFCAYLTDTVSGTFQDTDYDIIYYYSGDYSGVNEEQTDIESLEALYKGLSSLESVTSVSYAFHNGFNCRIPIELYSDKYIKYLGLTHETGTGTGANEFPISIVVYGIGDEVYRQYLRANNLSEQVYMDKQNPRGIAHAIVSRFDPVQQKYIVLPVFKGKTVTINIAKYDEEKWSSLSSEEKEQLIETGGDEEYKVNVPLVLDITDKDLVLGLNTSSKLGVTVMYPLSVFKELFGITNNYDFYFKAKNPSQAYEDINEYLVANGMKNDDHALLNKYEMKKVERNMVTIIKVFSYGFIALISLIAIANVFNTISTNIMLRRREFAMLKSVGMTTRSFNKIMNFECILYGLKSLKWGLPAAFGVTWLIYQSIKSGYTTSFYVPWISVLIAICSVFIVVFATMIYSMRKIKNDNPIDALKNENL
ncbi:MAG: ABC transporter permease [Clostridiaceae bacterium]|nr:ABC transporter permease [Clostridiaceae bacterium]